MPVVGRRPSSPRRICHGEYGLRPRNTSQYRGPGALPALPQATMGAGLRPNRALRLNAQRQNSRFVLSRNGADRNRELINRELAI